MRDIQVFWRIKVCSQKHRLFGVSLVLKRESHKLLTFPPRKRLFLNLRIKKAMKKVPSMRMRESRAVLGCILVPSDIASVGSTLAFRLLCTFGG